MLVDPHVHTSVGSADSIISPRQLIIKAKQRLIDAVCITDHFSYEGFREAQEFAKSKDVIAIKGLEIGTEYGDILIYGVDFHELQLKKIELDKLIDDVHTKDGAVIIPHPFGGYDPKTKTMRAYLIYYLKIIVPSILSIEDPIEIGTKQIGQIIDFIKDRDPTLFSILKKVDGIEVLNSTCSLLDNWYAHILAERLGKTKIGCSDAHFPEQVGIYATIFPSDIECERDFIQQLKDGNLEPKVNFVHNKFDLQEIK